MARSGGLVDIASSAASSAWAPLGGSALVAPSGMAVLIPSAGSTRPADRFATLFRTFALISAELFLSAGLLVKTHVSPATPLLGGVARLPVSCCSTPTWGRGASSSTCSSSSSSLSDETDDSEALSLVNLSPVLGALITGGSIPPGSTGIEWRGHPPGGMSCLSCEAW